MVGIEIGVNIKSLCEISMCNSALDDLHGQVRLRVLDDETCSSDERRPRVLVLRA